jgi:glutamyl endopeptidase
MARSRESRSASTRSTTTSSSSEASYASSSPESGEPSATPRSAEATGPVTHGLVSGGGARPEVTRTVAALPQPVSAAPLQEIPPFDETKAIPAEVVSYGGEDSWRLARLEAATPQAALADDRYWINNTLGYPQRCICQLQVTFWSEQRQEWKYFVGTGFIIGKRTVVTAGHTLYVHDASRYGLSCKWASEVKVIPGRNGNLIPYGTFTAYPENLFAANGWITHGQQGFNYGGIILNEDLPGSDRVFGYQDATDSDLANLSSDEHHRPRVEGYPGEKSGQMWGDDTQGLYTPTVMQLRYDFYCTGGQAGSPVYYIRETDGAAIAIGIHAYGSPSFNLATRITHEVYDDLMELRNMGGGVWE